MKNRSENLNKLKNSEHHRRLEHEQQSQKADPLLPANNTVKLPTHGSIISSAEDFKLSARGDLWLPSDDYYTRSQPQFNDQLSRNAIDDISPEISYPNRLSFQDLRMKIAIRIKEEFNGKIDGELKRYYTNLLVFDFPADDFLRQFVNLYDQGIRLLFHDQNIQVEHNSHALSYFDPMIMFPNNDRRKVNVVVIGEITIFKTNNTFISFRAFSNGDIWLESISIERNQRGKGIGSALVELAKESARKVGRRILFYPAPPAEESQGWDDSRFQDEIRKLKTWYTKLGFVEALPERNEATRFWDEKKITVGICGLMVFR